jgi:hypothetical protein
MYSKLPTLKAITLLPFATPSGRVVSALGYDKETQIYADFDFEAFPPIPENPTLDEIKAAVAIVWKPWAGYKFASEDDRAAMFAAIITTIVRPSLGICPGFFFDAPVQGSGKTKCAGALGALVKGRRAGVVPFAAGEGLQDELRKKLVAMAADGETFMLLDNVTGVFRSTALAAVITEGVLNERLLGGNRWFKGDIRMLITATGNNASLDHDLGRRLVKIRIDPKTATPQARSFDFDPVDLALTMRLAIASSVLTLVNAYWSAGAPKLAKGNCGFAEWNDLVRNLVVWISQCGFADDSIGALGDPAKSIIEDATTSDPEHEAHVMMLDALKAAFGDQMFVAKDAFALYERGGDFRDAIAAVMPRRNDLTCVSLGRVFLNRRDRIAGGLVLHRVGADKYGAIWSVDVG